MINVLYKMDDNNYHSIKVNGHAEFAESGKDLICASVSSIIYGFMNALDNLNEDIKINEADNQIEVINHSNSDIVNNYYELVIIQLKTIEESYNEFIKIERI